MKEKRGVSPVIATVLLISIALVLVMIVYVWAAGFIAESVEKNGQIIDYSCDAVKFEAEADGSKVYVTNKGNIPLHGFQIRVRDFASSKVQQVQTDDISVGDTEIYDFSAEVGKELELIPILLGESDSVAKSYICPDKNSITIEVA